MQAEPAEEPSKDVPGPGRAWRRAGAGLVAACALAVLTALAGQSPTADAWTALSADSPARWVAAAPPVLEPLEGGLSPGGPLTELDRGGDDLARVYRALHGGR